MRLKAALAKEAVAKRHKKLAADLIASALRVSEGRRFHAVICSIIDAVAFDHDTHTNPAGYSVDLRLIVEAAQQGGKHIPGAPYVTGSRPTGVRFYFFCSITGKPTTVREQLASLAKGAVFIEEKRPDFKPRECVL